MTYSLGKIAVSWDMQEINDLKWTHEPFNDPVTAKTWNSLYGLIFRTGWQADFRSPQPSCNNQILHDLSDQGLVIDKTGFSYYKMRPGDILPYHSDTYFRYRACHKIEIEHIWRVIVFLQDWQPGFLFEIEGRPVTQYAAGQFVAWQGRAEHMAGNLGSIDRYTLQITGIR